MDKFKIDGHKLIYHVDRVNKWLEGKIIYPIYIEISPTGSCNYRCTYCAKDFLGYAPRFLDTTILKDRLVEMGKAGVKSIVYSGEGEPLIHKDLAEIITQTKNSGIDAALVTNGVLMDEAASDKIMPDLTWIKVSIGAGTADTYALVHRTRPESFTKLIKNLSYAAELRKKNSYSCTLGTQIILLPENADEIVLLAKKMRDIGMDYLAVKPYSQHPLSKNDEYKDIKYGEYFSLAEELECLNSKDFHVVFRIHAMQKWDAASRSYRHCLALPFWAYIDSNADIWSCNTYLTKGKFKLGNIYESGFCRVWESKKSRELIKFAAEKLDTNECRLNCRMDEINRYLWELKNPPAHVNFI